MFAIGTPQFEFKLVPMVGPTITEDQAALDAYGLEGWNIGAVTSPSAVWNPYGGHDEHGNHVGKFEVFTAVAYLWRPIQP